jgi:hypothetical protein
MPGDAPIAVLAAIGTMRDHESRKLLEALVARRGADAAVTAALGADGSDWALDVLERWARFGDERGARAMTAIANVPGERPLAWLLDRAGELERIPAELVLEQKAIVDIALRQRRDPLFALVSSRIDDSVAREADLLVSARLFPERFVAELGPLAGASTPEAIALLIQGLERPALRVEARRALGKLRGRDLGPDPRAWQRWHRDVVAPGASMPLHGDRDPAPAPGLARKHILENRIHARADSLLLRAAARPVHRSPS